MKSKQPKMVYFGLAVLALSSFVTACAKVTQTGLKTSVTSGTFSDFVKVDSCTPTLQWEAADPADYQEELAKAIQTLEEQERQALLAQSQNTTFGANTAAPVASTPKPRTVTYDVAVYQALTGKPSLPPERGEQIFYSESIDRTSVQITPPLKPKTKYLWSTRIRLPDGRVGPWSAYNKKSFYGMGWEEKINYWFGIKTPKEC